MDTDNKNKQCTIQSAINWVLFNEQEPPDIVEDYIVYDNEGNIRNLQWYEGSCFMWCSGGHWSDEEGEEVTNIIYWSEKPCL